MAILFFTENLIDNLRNNHKCSTENAYEVTESGHQSLFYFQHCQYFIDRCRRNKFIIVIIVIIRNMLSVIFSKFIFRCPLCRCEIVLKAYEALLFQPRDKMKRKESEQSKSRNLPGFSKNEEDVRENRAVAELVDVNTNTFEYSKKGGFQASQTEVVLRCEYYVWYLKS